MPLLKCQSSKSTPHKAIRYITDKKKAEIVTVRNLFEDEDYAEQFNDTAKRFNKGDNYDERKYYHLKLSCDRKDKVNAQEAHLYAEELTARLFNDCECVIATHTDTATIHSHIIVNAVHPITGKKLRIIKSDYTYMKDEANRLGKEMGFSEIDFRKKSKNNRTQEEKHLILKGGTSWKEELREVISEAIKKTKTPEQFKEYLDKCYGVKITRDGKDYSYLHPEKQKAIRGERLGTNYTKMEVLKEFDKQTNGRTSTADNRGRSRFNTQHTSARTYRGSKAINSGGARVVITSSLNGVEREMQRLSFEAQCASSGTDAASEERRRIQQSIREETERRSRESAGESQREQLSTIEEFRVFTRTDNENSDGNRENSKYNYGKGD